MRKKLAFILPILLLWLASLPSSYPVFACGNGSIRYGGGGISCDVEVTIPKKTGGGGGGGSGGTGGSSSTTTTTNTSGRGNNKGVACDPGKTVSIKQVLNRKLSSGQDLCYNAVVTSDSCTHQRVGRIEASPGNGWMCEQEKKEKGGDQTTTAQPPEICNSIIVTVTGIECVTKFNLDAFVTFPGIELDTRPYPATLVRWDTVIRLGALPTNSGSASLAYLPLGGGSPDKPAVGDWRNITLTLTVYPKGNTADVNLQNIGWIKLVLGQLFTFHWNLPSHPAGGGGPLAGSLSQLEELPPDMPMLQNYAHSPYGLLCEMTWSRYDKICVPGKDPDTGEYTCPGGHEETGWWKDGVTKDVKPTEVKNLPPELAADTNNDGVPDAFWDGGIVIQRMNDANNIDDPVWAHQYSWGQIFYWAVREGQGQIGYP